MVISGGGNLEAADKGRVLGEQQKIQTTQTRQNIEALAEGQSAVL